MTEGMALEVEAVAVRLVLEVEAVAVRLVLEVEAVAVRLVLEVEAVAVQLVLEVEGILLTLVEAVVIPVIEGRSGGLSMEIIYCVHVMQGYINMYSLTCHDHCMKIFNNLWFEAH